MTHDEAYTLMCQVDLVKKQRRFRFAWRDVAVMGEGAVVSVYLVLGSDPRNIANWFRATKIASVERLEYQQGGWWKVYFRLSEVEA